MSTTELTAAEGGVPALASTPAALGGIGGADIALPKLYKGEFQSALVQDPNVPSITAGCIFVASGPDDPDPAVIIKDATKAGEQGVLVHVLAIKKGLSLQDADGELQTWAWGDPAAPAEAKATFTYFLALPEVDEDVPVKVTMAKTSLGCAKRINFHLLKHGDNPHELAFRLKLKLRESQNPGGGKYRWFVWVEELVEAMQGDVEIAGRLAAMAASAATPTNVEQSAGASNQPGI